MPREKLILRDYQKEGVDFLTSRRRVLLADEMGLGKTVVALKASQELQDYPVLVIAPKVALYVWQDELEKWFDVPAAIYSGPPDERKAEYAKFKEMGLPYMITNYAFTEEVVNLDTKWGTVICDEIHMAGLLNRKTKTFKRLRKVTRSCRSLFLLTGTPVRDTPDDLWGPLHHIDPDRFGSYWRFVHKHCIVIDERFGKSIERRPKKPIPFKRMLDQYMIRRLKRNVLDELPDKVRQVVRVDMSSKQASLYKDLQETMMMDLGDEGLLVTPNVVSQIIRLRQLLATPKVFDVDDEGGALKALKQLAQEEFDNGNCIVVFTPFRQPVPYIEEILQNLGANTYVVTGGMSARDIDQQVRRGFQEEDDRGALICVIKSGASFTAHKAPVAFFVSAEWSLIDNLQAEDRIHRIGQEDTVRIKYLMHRDTVDDVVVEQLNAKQMAVNWSLTPEAALARLKEQMR